MVLKRNGWYTSSYWHWRYFFSWSLDKLHDRNMFNRVMGNSVRFSKTFSSSLNFLIWYLWSYNCANRSSKILTRLQLRCMNFSVFVCFNRNNKVPAQFSQTFSCVFQEISKLTIAFQSFTPTSTGKKKQGFPPIEKAQKKMLIGHLVFGLLFLPIIKWMAALLLFNFLVSSKLEIGKGVAWVGVRVERNKCICETECENQVKEENRWH